MFELNIVDSIIIGLAFGLEPRTANLHDSRTNHRWRQTILFTFYVNKAKWIIMDFS